MLTALYKNVLFSWFVSALCLMCSVRSCLVPYVLCMLDVSSVYSDCGVLCAMILCSVVVVVIVIMW